MAAVLVVDDEIGVQQSLRFALDRSYDVATACSVAEAFTALRSRPFDVMVLDVSLPDCDGFDALRQIRNEFPGLPVLMFSARESLRVKAEAAGADGWLSKPPDLQELRTSIQTLVNARAHTGSHDR